MRNVLAAILFLLLCGCTENVDEPLTRGERRHVDTLMAQHQTIWRTYYDSICILQTDSLVNYYYDSLLRLEIEAIQKLER